MASKLFDKIEADATARIEEIELSYFDSIPQVSSAILMQQLDNEITTIIELNDERAFRNEAEYDLAIALAYEKFGVTEQIYREWIQDRDESFAEFLASERRSYEYDYDQDEDVDGDFDNFDGCCD